LPYVLDEDPIDLDTEADWTDLLSRFSSYDAYLAAKNRSDISSFRKADTGPAGKE
jgi:hypothetical protein